MRRLLPVLIVLLLAGCGVDFWAFESIQNSNNPHSTLVLVWISDSPVDGAEALEVTIDSVALVRADGVETIAETPQTLDLLALRNGARAKIGEGRVPAGAYRSIRLTLRTGGALGPRMRTGGTWEPLSFAAPGDNAIEVPFAFGGGDRSEIQIDFNARLSVSNSAGGLVLDPHLDAVDPVTAGEIAGYVRDAVGGPVAGAVVIVRQGGLEVRSTTTNPDGSYRLTPLPPGIYDVEVASPAGPLAAAAGVLVASGAAADVPLALP